jgi:hypothetical protein
MENTHNIIKAAGGAIAVAMRLDTTPANVRNQASKGRLPAAWYFALADMTGQTLLPVNLFSFKGVSDTAAGGR